MRILYSIDIFSHLIEFEAKHTLSEVFPWIIAWHWFLLRIRACEIWSYCGNLGSVLAEWRLLPLVARHTTCWAGGQSFACNWYWSLCLLRIALLVLLPRFLLSLLLQSGILEPDLSAVNCRPLRKYKQLARKLEPAALLSVIRRWHRKSAKKLVTTSKNSLKQWSTKPWTKDAQISFRDS